MRLILAPLALAGALSLTCISTFAHDSWLSRNGIRNSAGEWCCGEGDCGIVDKKSVKTTFAGYRIDGFMTIGEGSGAVRVELHELVPFSEAQPSPDGEFWRCKRPDGSRRCFFAPPPSN